jgi:hypothetical protein
VKSVAQRCGTQKVLKIQTEVLMKGVALVTDLIFEELHIIVKKIVKRIVVIISVSSWH